MKVPIVHLEVVRDRQADYCCGSIDSPEKAAEWVKGITGNASREQVIVCCMDGRMKPTHIDIVGVGGTTECPCPIPPDGDHDGIRPCALPAAGCQPDDAGAVPESDGGAEKDESKSSSLGNHCM